RSRHARIRERRAAFGDVRHGRVSGMPRERRWTRACARLSDAVPRRPADSHEPDNGAAMNDAHFDIVVIGAGPAGLAAAQEAAQAGARVAVLDDNPRAGGQVWRNGPAHPAPEMLTASL